MTNGIFALYNIIYYDCAYIIQRRNRMGAN